LDTTFFAAFGLASRPPVVVRFDSAGDAASIVYMVVAMGESVAAAARVPSKSMVVAETRTSIAMA
jgi:hypothetical protein